jgi:hypothetical protein
MKAQVMVKTRLNPQLTFSFASFLPNFSSQISMLEVYLNLEHTTLKKKMAFSNFDACFLLNKYDKNMVKYF